MHRQLGVAIVLTFAVSNNRSLVKREGLEPYGFEYLHQAVFNMPACAVVLYVAKIFCDRTEQHR
jgi:hypothetical protein